MAQQGQPRPSTRKVNTPSGRRIAAWNESSPGEAHQPPAPSPGVGIRGLRLEGPLLDGTIRLVMVLDANQAQELVLLELSGFGPKKDTVLSWSSIQKRIREEESRLAGTTTSEFPSSIDELEKLAEVVIEDYTPAGEAPVLDFTIPVDRRKTPRARDLIFKPIDIVAKPPEPPKVWPDDVWLGFGDLTHDFGDMNVSPDGDGFIGDTISDADEYPLPALDFDPKNLPEFEVEDVEDGQWYGMDMKSSLPDPLGLETRHDDHDDHDEVFDADDYVSPFPIKDPFGLEEFTNAELRDYYERDSDDEYVGPPLLMLPVAPFEDCCPEHPDHQIDCFLNDVRSISTVHTTEYSPKKAKKDTPDLFGGLA